MCFPLAGLGLVSIFFCFFGLLGPSFGCFPTVSCEPGSCLIVVICPDIIFIVCRIIMMIIYETECLKRFPPAWEPRPKRVGGPIPAEHLQLNYERGTTTITGFWLLILLGLGSLVFYIQLLLLLHYAPDHSRNF